MANIFIALRRAICLAVAMLAATTARAADPPSLETYGTLPDIEGMAMSLGGERLAAVMTVAGRRVLLIMTPELDPLHMLPLAEDKVRSMEWIGDDRLLLVVSQTTTLPPQFTASQFEFFHAIIVPTDPDAKPRVVFDGDPSMLNSIFGTFGARMVDNQWVAYFAGVELDRGARGYTLDNGRTGLFGLEVADNDKVRVAPAPPDGASDRWLVGPDGRVAATLSIILRGGRWSIKAPGGSTLASGVARQGEIGLVCLGKEGTSVIYQTRDEGDDVTRWFEVPLDGSAPPSEFAKAEEIDRIFTDRTNGKLLGLLRVGTDRRPEFFDPRHQAAINRIYQAFPDLDVTLADWTPDLSRVLVRTSGNGDSGTWYIVDLRQMRASAVGYERLALGPEFVGPISTVEYKAGDGLDIDGILTLPPDREAKNLPLVMLPHGGPHAHDEETFDWWAQAFASRGYAVFQPNFRGSTNRDEAFMRAGFGQWGQAMQTDISDGLAELARRGIVDPKRACIVGASYGGYAALAGVTLQQGLYRCAVAVAGVSDLSSLFSNEYNEQGRIGLLRRSLLEELGPRSGFDAVSPRRFAARADAPILLIHGRDDTVVPFEQSAKMADSLRDAGKPVEFVELQGEDHWLSRSDTRKQMLQAAVAFVEEHNPAD